MRTKRNGLTKSISILLLLVVFFVGCKKTALYHNLNEDDANEIVVVLGEAGINVEKEQQVVQNEISYNVAVDPKDIAKARKILVDRNLPRKSQGGLSGVYQDKGLIPTPDEQKARFLLAMKGEIINSLKRIPEVVDADVVINIPTPEEFATEGEKKRPTASVVIKVRSMGEGVVTQLNEAKIQQFVANSIENLNPRDVSVIISYLSHPDKVTDGSSERMILSGGPQKPPSEVTALPVATTSILGIKVSKDSSVRLKIYLSVFFSILIVLAAVLIVLVVRTTRMKQEFKALSQGPERPLLEGELAEPNHQLESGDRDEGPQP